MTAHDHGAYVPGCYRCELGRDEANDAQRDELRDGLKALLAASNWYVECLRRALRGVPVTGLGEARAAYVDAAGLADIALDEKQERGDA